MAAKLEAAVDQSSYVVQIDLTDETGSAISPLSATWTLEDGSENVINSREDVVISPLGSTMYIALSGDDINVADGNTRHLEVTANYISATVGASLPVKSCARFNVQPC